MINLPLQNVQASQLANGLTVLTDTVPTATSAAVGVWFNVGTRHEQPAQNGVAHLVEHMMFKGTARRTAFDIAAAIEDVGGQMNAYTSREQTAYHIKILPADVPLALDLLADMLQHSQFDATELDRERGVILQEISMYNDQPDEVLADAHKAALYPGQIFGKSILGEPEIIKSIPREACVDYVAQHYGAANAVLVAAGNVQHAEIMALAEKLFASLPAGVPSQRTPPQFTPAVTEIDGDYEQVNFIFSWPGFHATHAAAPAAAVLAQALGGGSSSRLFYEVREKRGLVYGIGSSNSFYMDAGLFTIAGGTTADKLAELIEVTADEVRHATGRLTAADITRAKAQLNAALLMGLEDPLERADYYGRMWHIYGRIRQPQESLALITAVDLPAVQQVARQIFSAPVSHGVIGPLASQLPLQNLPQKFLAA